MDKIDTLVFDLDGTLIDSAPDLAGAANRLLQELGRPQLPADRICSFVGDGAAKLVERCMVAGGGLLGPLDELTRRFITLYQENIADQTTVFGGVVETLAQLRQTGYRLAICTNKPEAPTHRLLKALELDGFFTHVVGGDSMPVRKPDPGHILGLLARMDACPANAVMIGDSGNDVFAGRDAGLMTILVTFGYCHTPIDQLPADARADHFTEIPDILAGFEEAYTDGDSIALDSPAATP